MAKQREADLQVNRELDSWIEQLYERRPLNEDQVRSVQVRSGQVRSGQVRSGQLRPAHSRGQARLDHVYNFLHWRLAWGSHGLRKESLGPTMPYTSTHCGRATTALRPF
jgi:hypothetical protein